MKISLESWNSAKISPIECTWKFQSNFIHISCHQLSTAVNSWWQLIKVDEIKNQPREPKFGMYITLSVYIKISVTFFSFQLSSAVNSWWKLLTVDEYENQSRKLKFGTYITLSMYMKIPVNFLVCYIFAKLSSCQQLVWARLGKNIQPIWVELSLAGSGLYMWAVIVYMYILTI